jgi:aryl-alcohol dehydrogenase-like predicted oxidoreductase
VVIFCFERFSSNTIRRSGKTPGKLQKNSQSKAAPLQKPQGCGTPAYAGCACVLLQRSPNILLIPGTSSVGHLRENLKAASLPLPGHVVAELDSIGGDAQQGASVPGSASSAR